MSTVYTAEQFEKGYPDGFENHFWTIARNSILLKELVRHGLNHEKILEIGCGRGGTVRFLRDNAIECFGVELGTCSIINGAKTFVRIGTDVMDLDILERDSFTVLMLLDVIEHISEPIEFLRELLSKFSNLKSLVITVPAGQKIWSNYDTFWGHYRRYDHVTIRETFQNIGMAEVYLSYFFHSLYTAAILQLHIRKHRELEAIAPEGYKQILHKVISYFFLLEYQIAPRFMKGTSILSISKRL